MTINIANTNLTNTFDYWRSRTNDIAYALSTYVVTTNSNTASGNAAISGTFTANVIVANSISIGGSNGSINTSVIVTTNLTTNVLISNIANVTSATITTLTSNSITSNSITSNSITSNVANLTSATITTLTSNSITTNYLNSNSIIIGNSTVNVSISSPNSVQQSNGQYFLNANGQYSLVSNQSNAAIRVYQSYTASSGQNTFTYSNGFISSLIDVYYNGVHLSTNDYTVINSTSFQLATNATSGAIVELTGFSNVTSTLLSFTVAGSNTQVQFNDSNSSNGSSYLTFDKTTRTLYISNTVSIGNSSIQYFTAATSGVSLVTLDTFDINTFRAAEYLISIKDNSANNYQLSKILITHDGGSAYLTEYGVITTNTTIANFSCTISSNNAVLQITPVSTSMSIKSNKNMISI